MITGARTRSARSSNPFRGLGSTCASTISRRGVLLLLVLMTSLVVSIIAFGGLMVQRLQLMSSEQSDDIVDARWAGRSAVAVAAKLIETDADWRTSYASGQWLNDVAEGSSTWDVSGVDPLDGNLANNATDRLELTGTGDQQVASQKIRMTIAPSVAPTEPLELAVFSDGPMSIIGGQVRSNGWIGSNESITAAAGALVNADAVAGTSIVGGTFAHRTRSNAASRPVPTMGDIDFHVAAGTGVTLADFPAAAYSGVNLIRNGQLDSDVQGWSAYPTCAVTHHPLQGVLSSGHMELHSRTSANDAALYDITNDFRSGESLFLDAYAMPETTDGRIRFSIVVETSSGTQVAATHLSGTLTAGTTSADWSQVSTTLTPTWVGRMTRAWLAVTTVAADPDPDQDIRIDNVSLSLVGTLPANTIYRSVITSNQTPFGVTPNANGIYVIDCAGQNVRLRDSRIDGTLVFLNATNGVTIDPGSVHWTTTAANLPAMIVDGPLTIRASGFALDEVRLAANFNPPGSPDRNSITDGDTSDRYESCIDGLVYASGNVLVSGDVVLTGGLVCGGSLTVVGDLRADSGPWKHGKPVSGFGRMDDLVTPNDQVFERVFN